MRYQKCTWNDALRCPGRCPYDNKGFAAALERWATGHDGEAFTIDLIVGGGLRHSASERKMLRKCRIYRLFDNGEIVLAWLNGMKTSQTVCDELRIGEEAFKEMVAAERAERKSGMTNKEFADKDKDFREACNRANISPTPRQASKWLNQRGIAWKMRNAK